MAESTVVKASKDGSILITDATPTTPLTLTVAYENGDFQISQPKWSSTTVRDRGTIVGERMTEQQEGTLSWSVHMRDFTIGTGISLVDVVEKTGGFSAAVSTAGDAYDSMMVDITFSCEGTDHNDSTDHTAVATYVKLEWAFAEGDTNTVNITGTIYGGVTRTGAS